MLNTTMSSSGTFNFSTLEEGDPYNSVERKSNINCNSFTNCVRVILYIELIIFIGIFGFFFIEGVIWELHRPYPTNLNDDLSEIENITEKILNNNNNTL
ncbi:hypothetical protein HCN44_007502 [Aphidius gifuensis]|uniref:Uncharacterized protein n=1 Tax=Aphidius gifuensis TaxID=684658 RepID=A0A835CND0_APHGI|nr:hypothetical protein HCN44_007502 [Aphidius gifuensis]